ncbi:MAG: excinuclease ABC subunit C [Candidatus Nealsonbacteria bacterium CG_4_10_14_0_2_um_filter_40_15]|uniref:Excinuclease ABC subunit C n=2 Tax=Candidatus Nealsoniibacteriota TaxID=1817911 RepID=A0A2M7D7G6_9BACT|nr:MAG: excinuclease ABC subunit C [Candidatus Nealsonbacteria bacterium CG02_land_8_20_14_3_00_40_11]PIZ87861.1 MAG: excinuclease ABC subunit C [Candidatus Nealsonbacteria bacterium CG_4_10_14_0_2_um_filter_40_15]
MPRTTVLNKFHYTYVLESFKDHKRYVGYTANLRERLKEHNAGKSFSTKPRLPFKLIYCEVCLNEEDARRRESFFKQTKGRRFITKRLKGYYAQYYK